MSSKPSYEFNFSLEVLNHLGRGLYRNFATVVAEIVSNSWDAEATEVHININKGKKEMSVIDNGKGMDDEDFRNKFLKVGYSRREDEKNKSKRKVFGRKGIGKLAMLSVSNKISIYSKKSGNQIVGGVIDNSELDNEIKNDGKYSLETIDESKKLIITDKTLDKGTLIEFEGLKPIINNPETLKRYLAMIFNINFIYPEDTFEIFVNGDKVGSIKDLKEINDATQFVWLIDTNKWYVL